MIKIYRKIESQGRTLYLELGKLWEIRFTRAYQEDVGFYEHHSEESKGFTRFIKDGNIIPYWYGFAYHDFNTDSCGYMPIPLNLIYASWRWFKYNVLRKIKFEWPRQLMLWEKRIYRLGQLDGYKIGRSMRVLSEGDLPEPEVRKMLEGVDPHTNPGWNKIYKAGE